MKKAISLFLTVALIVISYANIVRADWQGPTGDPPANNRPRPVDTSDLGQTKTGSLTVTNGLNVGTTNQFQAGSNGALSLQGTFNINGSLVNGALAVVNAAGHGIVGESSGNSFAGVYGLASLPGPAWAGYFQGPAGISQYLVVGGAIQAGYSANGDLYLYGKAGIAGVVNLANLTANRLVATDASKNLVNTITSANLASSISNETGNGAAVFGTSPTFTTGITVPLAIGGTGVASSLLLQSTSGAGSSDYIALRVGNNGATEAMRIINGGNVGIGTATPGAKLEVAGQIKITGGTPGAGKVLTSDAVGLATWQVGGGGGLPAGSSGQTLRHDGSNWVGNSVIYNNGSVVGIGTTNPLQKLHVKESGFNNAVVIIEPGTWSSGYYGELHFGPNNDGNHTIRGTWGGGMTFHDSDRFVFENGAGSELVRITNTGNVGIGTNNPGGNLEIEVADFSDPAMIFDSDGNEFTIGIDSSDADKFKISDSTALGTNDRLTIDSSGNVGIGNSSPGRLLEVYGTDPLIKFNGDPVGEAHSVGLNGFGFVVYNDADSRYDLVIDNAGNVGIGTTAPSQALELGAGKLLSFEGATDNAYETTFAITDPTADRIITFPNAAGTVSLFGTAVDSSEITDLTIVNADISASAAIVGSKLATDLSLTGNLTISGATLSGTDASNLYLNGNGDIQIRIDTNNNGTNLFKINNGANGTVFQVNEGGNATTTGALTIGGDKIYSSAGSGPAIEFNSGNVIIRLGQ